MGKQWKQWLTLFWGGSKITADGDCNHEIKRHLLLGRKVMTNLDSILKSRDITLPTKVQLVKAMLFPVVMYGCESWTIKKAECQRIDAFELWCWRRLLRVPWTARRSNKSIKLVIPSKNLILSSPSPPVFNLSQHQGLQMSQFFTSGHQSIGISASASVLPMNIQGWFPLG